MNNLYSESIDNENIQISYLYDFDFSDINIAEINTLAYDLSNNPLLVPSFCKEQFSDAQPSKIFGSGAKSKSCRGEWYHQGGGCFECKEISGGTFHCCDGDTKQCPDEGVSPP